MFKKFCPKCGKETKEFFENLCLACYTKKLLNEKKFPEKIEIAQCPICKDFVLKGKNFENIEKVLEKVLLTIFKKLPLTQINYFLKDEKIFLDLKLKINKKEVEERKVLKFWIKKTYCKYCKLKIGKYYEAVLQIRNADEKIIEKIKNFLEKIEKKDRMAFVSKEVPLKNGIDFYLGSKRAANKISRIFKAKYFAKTKITRKFYRFKNGKKIYRVTILIDFGKDAKKKK